MNKYSHHNNELTIASVGEQVRLKGWVSKNRDLGSLIFFDLRDKHGITQIIVNPESRAYKEARSLRGEYVVEVEGVVSERSSKNNQLKTGDIEVIASHINIIQKSKTPPIYITDDSDEDEQVTLKYRYLELRKPKMQKIIYNRHLIMQSVRSVLVNDNFIEIETPILAKSTPEGARDYLVPSRLYEREFYALPQSPQIYKQLLMVSSFEKYFQIAKCFRDEDLRSDRQPEFTQIDIEASFINEEDIMNLSEKMMQTIFKNVLNEDLKLDFPKIDYVDAITKYGSDKPLTYFGLEIINMDNWFIVDEFPLLSDAEIICGLIIDTTKISRKQIDELTKISKQNHAKFLGNLKNDNNNLTGSMAKWISDDFNKLRDNQMLFVTGGNFDEVYQSLGAVRLELAKMLNLIDEDRNELLWVVNFPMYEYSKEEERYVAAHHPFTQPKDLTTFESDPKNALARSYDLVWNGYEIGGGSIRINDPELQHRMFKVLGFSDDAIKREFGFLLEALSYGTPPHGGIAFGLDRISMLVNKTNNIKDVIAFPKTQSAKDLMVNAPSQVSIKQTDELHLKFVDKNE